MTPPEIVSVNETATNYSIRVEESTEISYKSATRMGEIRAVIELPIPLICST